MVTYYNNIKFGVDVLDQMDRAYSVKGGTHRWTVALVYNILDLAGTNAHMLYKECTSSKIVWRKFMQLSSLEWSSWREKDQDSSCHMVLVSSRSNDSTTKMEAVPGSEKLQSN